MAGLTLKAGPSFKHTVMVPVTGGDPAAVICEFRHRTRSELKDYIATLDDGNKPDEDLLMDLLVGWVGPDQEFSREAVQLLCENYPLAARAVSGGEEPDTAMNIDAAALHGLDEITREQVLLDAADRLHRTTPPVRRF